MVYTGKVGVVQGSCNADMACQDAAYPTGAMTSTASGDAVDPTVEIYSIFASCNAEMACQNLSRNGIIENLEQTCNAQQACKGAASGQYVTWPPLIDCCNEPLMCFEYTDTAENYVPWNAPAPGTNAGTNCGHMRPSQRPSSLPSAQPSQQPSTLPSRAPSSLPSQQPSRAPSCLALHF